MSFPTPFRMPPPVRQTEPSAPSARFAPRASNDRQGRTTSHREAAPFREPTKDKPVPSIAACDCLTAKQHGQHILHPGDGSVPRIGRKPVRAPSVPRTGKSQTRSANAPLAQCLPFSAKQAAPASVSGPSVSRAAKHRIRSADARPACGNAERRPEAREQLRFQGRRSHAVRSRAPPPETKRRWIIGVMRFVPLLPRCEEPSPFASF